MVGSKFRHKTDKILEPLGRFGDKCKLSPNKITVIGFIISILTGLTIFLSDFLTAKPIFPGWEFLIPKQNQVFFLSLAVIFLFFSGFCDVFDGAVARYQNTITKFGGFLDSVLDRYSDAIVIFSLISVGYCDIYIGTIALVGSLLVSYTRARGEAGGLESKYMAIGIAERSERMIIVLFAIFIQDAIIFNIPQYVPNQYWSPIGIAMLILAIITHFTVGQRMISAYKNFPKDKMPYNKNANDKKT